MVIKDRLLDESDGWNLMVCNTPRCGHIAYLIGNGGQQFVRYVEIEQMFTQYKHHTLSNCY